MDAAITAAKTLRIEVEIRNDRPGKGEQFLKGSLVLGGRNRLRFEQDGWMTATAVSDGRRTVIVAPDERVTRDTPDWFNDVLKGWLGRGGTYVSTSKAFDLLDSPGTARPGPADGPRVANAKVLSDEKVGGVRCRVVEYDLAWVEHPAVSGADTARVRVWIDPETKLPVRRTMTFPIGDGDRADSYTATHTKFEVNPKLDDKLFELPK
jgi:outer membrane lipoprotein-sorting protein